MNPVEGFLLWSSIFVLLFAFFGYLTGTVFKKERLFTISHRGTLAACVLMAAAIGVRWTATGHIPVMGTYENSLVGAWTVVVGLVVAGRFFPRGTLLSLVLLPLALLIAGNGIMTNAVLAPLEPPYQSPWLYVHVLFAWFAFGAYLLASTVGGLYLVRSRAEGRDGMERMREFLPPLRKLDEICLRFIIFGFITDAVMIGAGAIWARGLWGRYWGWDPIETWSLISWLTYGINLHLRLTLGWKGKKAAWVALLSFFGVLISFFGFGLVEGVHTQIMKPR